MEGIGEKKFVFQRAVIQPKLNFQEKKVKKNFGVSENGCIFAPAFDRGAALEERPAPKATGP